MERLLGFDTQFSLKVLPVQDPLAPLLRVLEIASVNVYLNSSTARRMTDRGYGCQGLFPRGTGDKTFDPCMSLRISHLRNLPGFYDTTTLYIGGGGGRISKYWVVRQGDECFFGIRSAPFDLWKWRPVGRVRTSAAKRVCVRTRETARISPLRFAPVEMTNLWRDEIYVSRKGPRNCRSLVSKERRHF